MKTPKPCHAYYYGGLPVRGQRRKGRLRIEGERLFLTIPEEKGKEKIELNIPFLRMEKVFLSRDNYYGSDTVLFNLAFRDEHDHPYVLRFAPVTVIPRRRIALQEDWFNFLSQKVSPPPAPA